MISDMIGIFRISEVHQVHDECHIKTVVKINMDDYKIYVDVCNLQVKIIKRKIV